MMGGPTLQSAGSGPNTPAAAIICAPNRLLRCALPVAYCCQEPVRLMAGVGEPIITGIEALGRTGGLRAGNRR